MHAGKEDDLQPLERLFLSPRPLSVAVGWLVAFVLVFSLYNGVPGYTPPVGQLPPAAAPAAPGQGAPPVEARPEVRIGLWETPAGVFNPLFATSAADREINGFLFEGLLRYGPDLRPEPNLAASYEVLPDQRTIVFRLRADARWHDGRPVTADDAVFTLETVLHKEYRGPFQGAFGYIEGAKEYRAGKADRVAGLQATDPATLTVTLEKPHGPALGEIGALPLLPRHAFAGVPVAQMARSAASTIRPVGAGPFRLAFVGRESQAEGAPAGARVTEVRLARFDGYFRGRPRLKEISFAVVGETLDWARLRQEGIDLVRVRWQDAGEMERVAGYALQEWPQSGYYYIGLNLARAPLGDRRFRQALAYAVDRQALAQELFGGHATLVHAPVFPGSWAEAPGMNPYAYDPDRARQLMAEAGWRDSDGDGLVDRRRRVLTLNLLYEKGKEPYEQLAALVRTHLGRVGVRVHLEPLSQEAVVRRVFLHRDFDLYLLDWRLGPDPDASALFGREARGNAVGFRYGEAQDLLARGARTVSIEERQPIYEAWTRLANEQLPYIFLFSPNEVIAVSERLRGLEVTVTGYRQGAEKWWTAW